ncbi:hypothetical protein ACQKK5_08655 [Brevibacillus panacihumi]|uniref:hypothetical protein n=1 Tax=Brevibacillus panacihumi TaxID=497735 RepID=UPI003D01C1E4
MFTILVEKEPILAECSAVPIARPLVGIELDDTQTQMLLSIARKHCKLALEHSQASTAWERRQEIIEEIQSLRSIRDDLIAEWRKQ